MKRQFLLMRLLLLFALIVGSGSAWAAKITDYKNIVSGSKYYIGATVSGTDYYFYADGSTTGDGIQGTSKTNRAEASVLVFEGSGESWTIKFDDSDNYLSLKNSKDNGKVKVQASSATWTLSNVSDLIHLAINSYCLQKNSGASLNFGSYSSGQKDVWLEEATTDPEAEVSTNTLAFGSIVIDETKDLTFDVTPKNLTKKLTITSNNDKYTVDVDEIAYNASKTTVTVTAAPTAIGDNMSGKIIISGDDLDKDVEVTLSATVIRKASGLAYTPTSVTLTQGDSFEVPTFSKAEGISSSSITFSSSYNEVATVSNEGVISLGSSTGTAIIKATFAQTDVYEAGEATCTITVNPAGVTPEPSASGYYEKVTSTDGITTGKYLIVNEEFGVAYKGSAPADASNNVINVTISESRIVETETIKANEFSIDTSDGSIKAANGKYIGRTANSTGINVSDDALAHTFSISSGNATIRSNANDYILRYNGNSGQNRFRYYSGESVKPVQLYKYVAGSNPDDINIYVSAAGYATYVSGFDLDFSTNTNLLAYIAKEISDEIKMVEVTKAPAGTGLLLHAVDGGGKNYTVSTTDASDVDVSGNLLKQGNDAAVASVDGTKKNYILNVVDNKLGFFKANGQIVAKNRAYLQTTVDASRISLIFDDETTGINAIENGEKATENAAIYNLNGQRVMNPGKGLYIVNGKKVIINK